MKVKAGDKVKCENPTCLLTKGKIYEVQKIVGDTIWVFNDMDQNDGWHSPTSYIWNEHTFVFESAKKSLEDQILYAKSLLYKRNLRLKYGHKTDHIFASVVIKYKGDKSSCSVEEYLKDHDFCVAVATNEQISIYPAEWITIAPTSKEVKLDGGYIAVVFEDHVDIATQRLTLEDLNKILEAHEETFS